MGYKDLSSSGKKQISAAISALQNNDVDGSHEKAILLIKGHVERKVLKDIEKEVTDVIKAEVTPGAREAEIIKIKEEVVQKEINLLKEAAKEEGKTQEEIDGITEEDLDPIAIADLQNTAVEDSESRIQSAVNRAVQAELTLERAKGDDENRYILAVNDARNELDNNRFDLAAGQMDSLITAIKDAGVQAGDLSIMENLGLGSGAAKVEAKDANIIYNGAEFTLSSNEFTINGMTMTLKGLTQGESVSVNVANDTEAVYDMVKEFVKNYNDILKEMNELYNAPSGRDYAPLSDEDMEAMTDKQIEKWEGKIEESILRRDTTLGSVIDTLRITSMTSVNVGGKNMSLASFGIVTSSDYTEKGLLHIKGDADDAIFGSDNNVLMKMLREDPESLIEGLSKITSNLYDSMADKMKSIPNTRSAFTFYNDKSMDKQLKQYGKDVTAMEKKLKAIEDKYYKQFAVMETAMAKLQSQSNALASMMGMGQQQ